MSTTVRDLLARPLSLVWGGMSDAHSEFWVWIERISWAAVVVGLPIGIYQVMMLRNEQGRVARELARRPDVLVGFHPLTESHGKKMLQQTTDVTATWQPGSHLSDPVQFTIVCHNAGDLTARNVLYNFSFPAEMDHMINTQVLQGKMF